ncbi:MAG: PEP-CTERM sorting domain-containing protein [Tepidisphaeraceae bacterium]
MSIVATKALRRVSLIVAAVASALIPLSSAATAAPILPGNLVVVRAAGGPNGDASAALLGSGTAAAVFFDEYTPAGSFVQSILVNQTVSAIEGAQRALTLSGTQNLEGHITLSQDGNYMAIAGYNQAPTVIGTNASAATAVERVVGLLNLGSGTVNTATAFADAVSQQSVRSAYSTNGSNVWLGGNGGNNVTIAATSITTNGIHFGQVGVNNGISTLSTQLNSSGLVANNRTINVFNGRMYVSNGNTSSPTAPARGVDIFSSFSIPTTGGQSLISLPGFPTTAGPAPDDYWFMNDDTVYLADVRTDGINGGIQKWARNVGTNVWELQYTMTGVGNGLTTIGGGAAGVHGLTGYINGLNQAVLFATGFDGAGANQTKLFTLTDIGAASPYTTLATSAVNTAFRGVEIALLPPIPEPTTLGLFSLAGLALIRRRRD